MASVWPQLSFMAASFLRLPLAGLVFLIVFVVQACQKDDPAPDTTDRDLAALARDTTGFTWFAHDPALRPKSSGSGHTTPWLRTRYNATAAVQLDPATGHVRAGAIFGEGAVVVKELHQTPTGGATQYAIIRKDPRNANAAANGWVWAIYNADGSVSVSATMKGTGCASCHAQTDNIDGTLMNKFFP
jgi:Cytochrome P460